MSVFLVLSPNKNYDKSCVIQAGSHEFIVRDSFIFYHHLRIDRAIDIEERIQNGEFIVKTEITDEIYLEALRGVITSKEADRKFKRFLKNALIQQACMDFTK